MAREKDTEHIVVHRSATGAVRTRVRVADAKSAEILARKMTRTQNDGWTVEIQRQS